MSQQLHSFALLVSDYDEAIAYYTETLGFYLVEDTPMGGGKRWVVVKPGGSGSSGAAILLAKAKNDRQQEQVGDQCGGRVFLFLHTDDFMRDYNRYRAAGVAFEEGPRTEPFGLVAVFQDRYGNRWDLIERRD